MSNTALELSSPWVNYARKIYLLFCNDPEVHIIYDTDAVCVRLLVDNEVKADAISKILPIEKKFGNVTLAISVIPSNKKDSMVDIYRKAFNGNPIFKGITELDTTYGMCEGFAMFENSTVQYFNDSLHHPDNIETTTYEELAMDVLAENSQGVFFATETGEDYTIWP